MIRGFMHAAAYAVIAVVTFAGVAHAASAPAVLTVESVLSPAWVERANARREPLAVGRTLGNKRKCTPVTAAVLS